MLLKNKNIGGYFKLKVDFKKLILKYVALKECKPWMSKSRVQFAGTFNYLNNSQFSCFLNINFMIVWMMNTNTPWSGKSMILLVDLDLQKIHLRRFMYTTWKKLIIMIIIIRFGIEPGLNKTIIPTVSNNFMLVWMMNTSIILEQGGVWVLERFYLLFSFLFWLKTYYI